MSRFSGERNSILFGCGSLPTRLALLLFLKEFVVDFVFLQSLIKGRRRDAESLHDIYFLPTEFIKVEYQFTFIVLRRSVRFNRCDMEIRGGDCVSGATYNSIFNTALQFSIIAKPVVRHQLYHGVCIEYRYCNYPFRPAIIFCHLLCIRYNICRTLSEWWDSHNIMTQQIIQSAVKPVCADFRYVFTGYNQMCREWFPYLRSHTTILASFKNIQKDFL